jgi:hypothetical protein
MRLCRCLNDTAQADCVVACAIFLAALVAVVMVSIPVEGPIPVEGQQPAALAAVVLKPAAILDPHSGQLTRGATVVVRGDRIEAVGASVTPPPGAKVTELSGLTCCLV